MKYWNRTTLGTLLDLDPEVIEATPVMFGRQIREIPQLDILTLAHEVNLVAPMQKQTSN